MKRVLISVFLLCGYAFMASSQEVDRDRSKYAVNNFADDDIYTMYEPYATVKVNEPDGRKVKNIILMIGDGMGLEQISAAWVCNGGSLNLDNFSKIGIQPSETASLKSALECNVQVTPWIFQTERATQLLNVLQS